MKKICNLTTSHTRYDQRVFLKECLTERQRYEVHLVVSDGKPDELKDGIRIHGTKRHSTRLGRSIFSAFQVYRRAKSINADIYVFHDHDLLWLALLLKRDNNVVIWDCHENYLKEMLHISGSLKACKHILRYIFIILSRVVTRKLDGCITICDALAIWLQRLGCKSCYVLHNYALKREFQDIEIRDHHMARCVLYVGSFSPTRYVHVFIQGIGLCKHKNIKLIIGGKRAPKQYERYCKKLTGWERVEFHRNMSRTLLKQKSKLCFAGLIAYKFPGKAGGSPVKFYEYMALGLPVIFGGDMNEAYSSQVDNNGHPLGLIVNSNPQVIADTIDMLYENKELAWKMGENGRKAFETEYNFESEADGFLKFLEKVSQFKEFV